MPLPEAYRLRDVEVVLSGEPVERILLACTEKQRDVDCRARIGEYDVASQRWMEIDE